MLNLLSTRFRTLSVLVMYVRHAATTFAFAFVSPLQAVHPVNYSFNMNNSSGSRSVIHSLHRLRF